MNQQLPPEADQLGAPQAEYTANRLTAKIMLGTGIVSGLISLLSLSIAIKPGDNVKNQSPHHNPVVWGEAQWLQSPTLAPNVVNIVSSTMAC